MGTSGVRQIMLSRIKGIYIFREVWVHKISHQQLPCGGEGRDSVKSIQGIVLMKSNQEI